MAGKFIKFNSKLNCSCTVCIFQNSAVEMYYCKHSSVWTEMGKKAFSFSAPDTCNNLQREIKSVGSLIEFF